MDNKIGRVKNAAVPAVIKRSCSKTAPSVLVMAAWAPELEDLEAFLKQDRSGLTRFVRTAIVGVGLVEAGIGAALALAEASPTAAILIGTAGVFRQQPWKPPQAVAVDKVFLGLGDPPSVAERPAPMSSQLVTAPRLTASLAKAAGVSRANVVCPLAITRGPARSRRLVQETGAALENLEAFAVVHAAHTLSVPITAILGIANQVGPQGGAQWRAHGADAAAQACAAVIAWLKSPLRLRWLEDPRLQGG